MSEKPEDIKAPQGTSAPAPALAPAPAPDASAAAAPPAAQAPGVADALVHETPGLLETFDADKAAKAAELAAAKPDQNTTPKEGDPAAAAAAAKPDDAPAEKPGDKPGAADAKPEAKADKPPVEGDKPKAEVDKPGEKPAEPKLEEKLAALAKYLEPVEYKFELPATLKPDDAKLKAFTELLGAGEVKVPAELGQKLINMHGEAMTAFAEQLLKDQHKTFLDVRKSWQTEVKADPVLGGAGFQTAMGAVARARDALVSDARPGSKEYEADMKAFYDFGRVTGATDHPIFLRILHRMSRYLDEPQGDRLPADIRPSPSNGKPPKGGSIYKHASSSTMNNL